MSELNVKMTVRHPPPLPASSIFSGDVSAFAEDVLMEAYAEANTPSTHTVILNFGELEYMNSSGIGLLVTLLIRSSGNSNVSLPTD